MKKIIILILSLLCLPVLCSCDKIIEVNVHLEDNDETIKCGRYGDFGYAIKKGHLYITNYSGNDETVVIPSKIKKYDVHGINRLAFTDNDYIKEIKISHGIKFIDIAAFLNLDNLKSIYLPNTLTYTPGAILIGCENFENFYIEDLNSYIEFDKAGAIYAQPYNLYLNGKLLEDVVLPSKTKELKKYTFTYCNSIKSLTLNDELESIGEWCIKYTHNLKSIRINDLAKYCNIDFDDDSLLEDKDLYINNKLVKNLEMPDEIQKIPGNAFIHSNIESVKLPYHLKTIGSNAFNDSKNLKQITFNNRLERIGSNAFEECTGLTNITLPENLKVISKHAFNNCINLTNVSFNNNLEEIESGAFGCCYKLTNINLPNTLKIIDSYAFLECESLNNVIIPDSVNYIGSHCFKGCKKLNNIKLSKNISVLPYSLFEDTNLKIFVIPRTIKEIEYYVFSPTIKAIYIPKEVESISDYIIISHDKNINTQIYCERSKDDSIFSQEFKEHYPNAIYDYKIKDELF